MSATILIVDDEEDLVETLRFNLEREGYHVVAATRGRQALDLARSEPKPDIILLDLMLPDLSGTEVCRALRGKEQTASIPVIMLTAKGEEVDRVVGLELGADDYITKPFSVRELLLRLKAVLRRTQAPKPEDPELRFGDLRIDAEGHRVFVGLGEVELTALEFRLLNTLLTRQGRVQTRERLLEDVWGMRSDLTTRTVDTHVLRLRRKLGDAGRYIETMRGVGYRFTPAR